MAILQATDRNQTGFTLIEILVAMTLLAIGILGISLNTTQGLKAKIDSHLHASVMQVATRSIEPLNQALHTSTNQFDSELTRIRNGIDATSNNYPFKIAATRATDALGNDLFNTEVAQWHAPFELLINIRFQPDNGIPLNFPLAYVLVP